MNWFSHIKLAAQGLTVTVDPSITEFPLNDTPQGPTRTGGPQEAAAVTRTVIQNYYRRIDPAGDKFMAGRYIFNLKNLDNNYQFLTLNVQMLPKSDKRSTEDMVSPEHPMYDYYMKHKGGKTGRVNYKAPKDAIKAIPEDPSMGYRGIAWEEWQSIQKTGGVASKGHYNLGDKQEGLTCFGYTPSTALHYASGFAPIQYSLSVDRPGVVIAVPRSYLLTSEQDQGVPSGELGLRGVLGKDKIAHAWMMVVTQASNTAHMEFRIPWVNANERYDGMMRLGLDRVQSGSGNTNVVSNYAIRQMF